jgi:regulator of sigma E protease
MLNILGALVALGILVTVHEAGHFIAARLFGVEIEKFSLGFGPKLLAFTKGKTEYRISLIPLGGYVKMKGENPDEELENPETSFRAKSWWQRAIIAFAGPFMNFILAMLLFITSFGVGRNFEDLEPIVGSVENKFAEIFLPGDKILEVNENEIFGWNQIMQYASIETENVFTILRDGSKIEIISSSLDINEWYSFVKPHVSAVVGEVSPGMPAYKAGLMANDVILEVDGESIDDWYEMRELITQNPADIVSLLIERDGKTFEKSLKLETNIYDDNKIIGITQKLPVKIHEKFTFSESIKYGTITTVNFVYLNYAMLIKLVANPGALKSNIGGPVMMYTMSQQTAGKGLDVILNFIGMISLILMIMNLLPIPILDGGHIFFCFIEGVFKKPLPLKIQIALQNVGLFLLMFLMVFAFWNDISRIFTRNASINQQKIEMGN